MNLEIILDHEDLYRRIREDCIKEDGTISSAAYSNTSHTDDMSVNLARLTTSEKTIAGFKKFGVAKFLAGFARGLNQKVIHDPTPDNHAHTTVRGRKSRSIRKRLADNSILILQPYE